MLIERKKMDFNINTSKLLQQSRAVDLDPNNLYDVLIIGGGPAGLSAAVYAMRKGLSSGLMGTLLGGMVVNTASVQNYMGFKYVEGSELMDRFVEQVKQFEIGIKEYAVVTSVKENGNIKEVTLKDGSVYKAKTLIVATGKFPIRLNIPGEAKLSGKGVSYCTTCDAPLYKDKTVAIIGGGNSGVESAIDVANFANKVYVIEVSDTLRADHVLDAACKKMKNIEFLLAHKAKAINGEKRVESILLEDLTEHQEKKIEVDGIFISIGLQPNSGIMKDLVAVNERGEIIVDCNCRTSREGIFAAGDVTTVPYKQIIIASGEGAKAALSANDFLLKHT